MCYMFHPMLLMISPSININHFPFLKTLIPKIDFIYIIHIH